MKRLLALSLIAACGMSGPGEGAGGGYGDGLGTPENPVPQSEDQGPYNVVSTVDFTAEAILPAQIELVVVTLRSFSQNPARGLIDAADAAGVAALKTLYDILPGVLTDRFEGWINDELAKIRINGRTLPQYAGDVAAIAETALTQFQLDSTLAIRPGEGTHTLTAIDFAPAGFDVRLPITGLAADIFTQHPTITVAEAGAFSLGDQRFGLNFGEYAWDGVNAMSTKLFGGTVRATLGKVVNCPALAHTIATKCVLTVCVGHEAEVKEVCNGGLDALVNGVHDRFTAYNLDAFRFKAGAARLVDDDQDGIADRIVDGTWDAEINVGLGLRHAPATFTAAR